jgi:hypothetical protein
VARGARLEVRGRGYDRRQMATAPGKRSATVEEVLVAVEAARDKVMADEIKSLTKLGIPKAMAYQMISSRFHQGKAGSPEEAEPDPFESTSSSNWDDIG